MTGKAIEAIAGVQRLEPHGALAAATRHYRAGETPCGACSAAQARNSLSRRLAR